MLHGPPAIRHTKSIPVLNEEPVRGVAFHFCSCSIPCSCLFNGKNIDGCNVVKVYHYTVGGYMGKQIVNRTVVIVPHPKELQDSKKAPKANGKPVDSVIYLPLGLTPQQEQNLLTPIMEMDMQFAFQNSIRRHVKILFRPTEKGYEVTIPGVFHVITEKALGANDKQIIADNLETAEGSRWFLGRTKQHTYQDGEQPAWKWSLPNKMGSWTFFRSMPHKEF